MSIDSVTVNLLGSVLGSLTTRRLFTTIASSRIAKADQLVKASPDASDELHLLEQADLIGADRSRETYYVTAKGLKVARDLEKLPSLQNLTIG